MNKKDVTLASTVSDPKVPFVLLVSHAACQVFYQQIQIFVSRAWSRGSSLKERIKCT